MTAQPWPMGYEKRAGMTSDLPFDSALTALALLAVDEQAYWRCHDLDRAQDGYPLHLTTREAVSLSGEFIERFGYDAAKRFITEVLHTPEESVDCEFLELRTNLRQRFGRKGPLYLAGYLAAERAITGHEPQERGA